MKEEERQRKLRERKGKKGKENKGEKGGKDIMGWDRTEKEIMEKKRKVRE